MLQNGDMISAKFSEFGLQRSRTPKIATSEENPLSCLRWNVRGKKFCVMALLIAVRTQIEKEAKSYRTLTCLGFGVFNSQLTMTHEQRVALSER